MFEKERKDVYVYEQNKISNKQKEQHDKEKRIKINNNK